MKNRLIGIFVLLCILLVSFSVSAINFTPEDTYNSVVVVYTNSGVGSGFCIKENLILTNAHVVGDYRTVDIKLYDKSTIKGDVVKVDAKKDMAVIQVEKEIEPLAVCSEPKIGEEVYAIGAPKDMPYTMTKGIISALERELGNNTYIQIDASVNSGNSGGPLVNDNGQVLGMITLKASDAEGIGFAIKAKDINDFINGVKTRQDKEEIDITKDTEEDSADNNIEIEKTRRENDALKIAVCVLFVLNIVLLLLFLNFFFLLRKNKKDKDEYDFEIEIEE